MKIERHVIGTEKNTVVVIDDFLPNAQLAVEIAAGLDPFPQEDAYAYPGQRHNLTPDHRAGAAYAQAVVHAAGPTLTEIYGPAAFQIAAASFSVVTRRPIELTPAQRLPHTDSYDGDFIALLHNLHHQTGTGTAFYRHRRTGFEKVSEERRAALEAAWRQDDVEFGDPKADFFGASDARYEQIFSVGSRFNRLLIYQGALFHSGLIPPDFTYDPNPRSGRLMGMICLIAAPAR